MHEGVNKAPVPQTWSKADKKQYKVVTTIFTDYLRTCYCECCICFSRKITHSATAVEEQKARALNRDIKPPPVPPAPAPAPAPVLADRSATDSDGSDTDGSDNLDTRFRTKEKKRTRKNSKTRQRKRARNSADSQQDVNPSSTCLNPADSSTQQSPVDPSANPSANPSPTPSANPSQSLSQSPFRQHVAQPYRPLTSLRSRHHFRHFREQSIFCAS